MSEEETKTAPEADSKQEEVKKETKPNKKSPKKKSAAAASKKKKSKQAPISHPHYRDMIRDALTNLKERGGSSRQAILKYIMGNYKILVEEKTANNHLKMALRAGVKNGTLNQSKGQGASGSFKLGDVNPKKKSKNTETKSDTKDSEPKKTEKKSKSQKKAKKPKPEKKAKTAKKSKSPKKKAGKKRKPKTSKPKEEEAAKTE